MIDLAGIGSLVSVLTGLLVAGGSLMLQRQRKQAVDADDVEDELEIRNEQYTIALRHMRYLEDLLVSHSDLAEIPRRPVEIRAGYFQERQQGGRKRRSGRHAAPADNGGPPGPGE